MKVMVVGDRARAVGDITLEFARVGNYINVNAVFDQTGQGCFGSVKLDIHAAQWREFVRQLQDFDVHKNLEMHDCGDVLTCSYTPGKK